MIRLFHRTTSVAAESIVAAGFRDSPTAQDPSISGVWLSNCPVDERDGFHRGDTLLEVLVPFSAGELFYKYELVDTVRSNRYFIVPASELNGRCTVRRLSHEESKSIDDVGCWNEYPDGEPDRTFAELAADDAILEADPEAFL